MRKFMEKYAGIASSVLSGFDRLVFRGYLRSIVHPEGMKRHLSYQDVPRRLFGAHVEKTTNALRKASLAEAEQLGRPIVYLRSSRTRKEAVARQVLQENPVDSGLLCVLTCVEPCMTWDMRRNAEKKQLELVYRLRKCLHLYHYYVDEEFGFMHARIQTWYPFHVQICMNGREWLARRLDESGCGYVRHQNSFLQLDDCGLAQGFMDQLVRLDWVGALDGIAARLNPAHDQLIGPQARYYWTAYETEWATDISCTSSQALGRIYPQLVWGAIATFSTPHVMRFLGKQFQGPFQGEAASHYQERPEGLSIRHNVNGNSIKMYDKGGSVLRVETTITQPSDIRVYRPKEGGRADEIAARPMRKGIADLERRTQVSQRANERYLDALAEFDTDTTLAQLLCPITKRVTRKGKTARGLRPWDQDDLQLLEAINRPEYLLAGFRNKDISALLFPKQQTDAAAKRAASGKTSYRLRLLRAHGLIVKINGTRGYRITKKGRQVCTALLLAQHATVQQLTPNAA